MKKDQANKTNVERVYRWWPLAWEPGPNGSSIDLQLVLVIQVVQVHIGVGVEQRQKRQSGGRWGWRWLEVGREGEGRSYHDRKRLWRGLSPASRESWVNMRRKEKGGRVKMSSILGREG